MFDLHLRRALLLFALFFFVLALPLAGCPSAGDDAGPGAALDAGDIDAGAPLRDPFVLSVLERSRLSAATSQNDERPFDLGDGPFANVTLLVDLETSCQPFDSWGTEDNPIPPGHNWPASCDAFDRNLDVIVDRAEQGGDPPGFALLRSITPFGGARHIEVDVTDWANAHPGEHRLWGHITTWTDPEGQVSGSEGGWWLSASLDVTPGTAPREVIDVISLFEGDITSGRPGRLIDYTMPAGATRAELHYVTSGHGGGQPDSACIGPADEFCEREHEVTIDGQVLGTVSPWRTDCADFCTLTTYSSATNSFEYCAENPCGAIQSVQAPRANWCPGDDVAPFVFENVPLTAGQHTAGFAIDQIGDGGVWGAWVVLFVYGD